MSRLSAVYLFINLMSWVVSVPVLQAARVPYSGQTKCYDSAGTAIACAGTGQDGELPAGTIWPVPRFVTYAEQSVSDTLTNLTWVKDGNLPGPVVCAPAVTKNWLVAQNYINCLNKNLYLGKSDWRIPSINELRSLINYGQAKQSTWLLASGFTGVAERDYWSSTTSASSPSTAWTLTMGTGGVTTSTAKSTANYVLPVRTGGIPVTIAWSNPASITYGTALGSSQLNATSNVPGSFSYVPPSGTVLDAGTSKLLKVLFTPTDIANNSAVEATVTIDVGNAPQTITFNTLAVRTFGDAPLALSAAASSGLNVVFTSSNQNVATVSGGKVTIVGAGTTTITANQPGTTNYQAAPEVPQTLLVNKATLTVTADNLNRAYGADNPPLTLKYSGFVKSDTTAVLSGIPALSTNAVIGSNVGSYPIVLSQGTQGADNYNFNFVNGALAVNQASQTITFGVLANRTYGDNNFTLTATGGLSGNPITYSSSKAAVATVGGNTVVIVGAGATTITANQAGSTNYLAATAVMQTLTVILDAIAPDLTVSSPANGLVTNVDTLTFNGTATDAGSGIKSVTVNGEAVTVDTGGAFSANVTLVVGLNSITAVATDNFGNSTTVIRTITFDQTPPVLMVSTLPNGSATNNATLNVSGTATDPESGIKTVTVNGQTITVGTGGAFSTSVTLVAGANTITVVATNNGTVTTTNGPRTITYDPNAPVVTIDTPADNIFSNVSPLTVSGSINEIAAVTVVDNSGTPEDAVITGSTFTATVVLTPGLNHIDIVATDPAGNLGSAKRTVTYDPDAPNLAITDPPSDITTAQSSYLIKGTVSDLTTVALILTVNGQSYTPTVTNGTFSQLITFTTGNHYTIIAVATDHAGNSSSAQRNIIYQPPSGATVDLGSVSCLKGATITVPLTLTNVAGIDIATLGMDIEFDSVNLLNPVTTIGAAGTAASKAVNATSPATGVYRIGVLGLNATPIGNGAMATVSFTCSATAPLGAYTLINTPSASDVAGETVIVTGKNGTITVINTRPGDCNGDTTVSIAEVQGSINMYLGSKTIGCGVDTNGSNSISIAEVQKVINGYLGM